jgi:hypothetical protein
MKTYLFLAAAFCVLSFAPLPSTLKKTDVFTAIEHKLITLTATGTGGNSEECIAMCLKPTGGTPLEVTVPAGAVFDNNDPLRQDIMITRPITILAKVNNTVTCKAYGFCCAATKGVPAEGDVFALRKAEKPAMTEMANVLAAAHYPPAMEQAAVWTVTNNHSLGSIFSANKEQTQILRAEASRITGKPIPFYDVDYGYQLNETFEYTVKEVSGEIQVAVRSRGKSTLALYAPDKEVVDVFYVDRPVQPGMHTIRFKYTSSVLEPGTYTVALWVDGRKADERKIEL